jgi:hypothetical protein
MRWLLLLALLLPVRAAAIEFFSALDHCSVDTSADQHFWDAIVGTPTLVTSSLDGHPGNLCAYGMSVPSGSALYLGTTTACGATCYAGRHIKFTSCPTTRRRIASFRSTDDSKTGAILTVEADPTQPTARCILKAFYESEDLIGGECSASATMDGTECGGACTTNADCVTYDGGSCVALRCANECDAANEDVGSSCREGTFAQIAVPVNSWRAITLGQVNTTGAVQVVFYEGAVGSAHQRGAQTRSQGKCTGGTTAGRICTVNGDCSGGGTCTTTDVVTIEEVRWGTDDTTAGAFEYVFDTPWIDTATAQPNVKAYTLLPTADGTLQHWETSGGTNCGSTDCFSLVDDGNTPDIAAGSTDIIAVDSGNPDPRRQDFAMSNPPTPLPTPILAVNLAALVKDNETGASRTSQLGLIPDPSGTAGAYLQLIDFDDDGASAIYHPIGPAVFPTPVPGSTWDDTSILGLSARIFRWASTHNTNAFRATTVVGEVLARLPDPPVPTVLPDRNLNGIDTVVLAGDSTWNQAAFHQTLASGLLEPTNLFECATDGGTIGDIVRDLSVVGAVNDIVETSDSASGWECNSLKGTGGDTADVVIVNAWANSQHINSVFADPAMDTDPAHQGQGTGLGICHDNGGADEGNPCVCPIHSAPTLNLSAHLQTYYCLVGGTKWKTAFTTLGAVLGGMPCDPFPHACGCTCNSNADCKLTAGAPDGVCAPIPTPTAPAATRTAGNPTPKVCTTPNAGALNSSLTADPPNKWWGPACVNANGCPNGLCMAAPNEAYVDQQRAAIESALLARPTSTGPWNTPTPPAATPPAATPTPKPPLLVWALPPGPMQNLRSGFNPASNFPTAEQKTGKAREELKARAEAASIPWVDLGACLLRDCTGKRLAAFDSVGGSATDGVGLNGETFCLRDGIHPSDVGDAIQGQCLINCLTNAQGTSDGICGPTPTAPLPTPGLRRCTQGKVNDHCTANADCSTYHCDFGAAP